MTIRQHVPNGAPCWIDLMSSDTDKSRAFYGELLRVDGRGAEPRVRRLHQLPPRTARQVAGLMTAQEEGMPDVWSVYLAVDDAEKTVEVAKANGAPGVRRADGGGRPRHDGRAWPTRAAP